MKKGTQFFLMFCLALCVVIQGAFLLFSDHFAKNGEAQAENYKLKQQVAKYQAEMESLSFQIRDLRSSVGLALADVPTKSRSQKVSQLMATLREPASVEPMDLSSSLLIKAKTSFNSKDYKTASNLFAQLDKKYPLSPHRVEAMFWLAESYFQLKDYRRSLTVIDQLMSQFPDQDLTGFSMIRLGQISVEQGQYAEAEEIFQTIAEQFPKNKELKAQALDLAQKVSRK